MKNHPSDTILFCLASLRVKGWHTLYSGYLMPAPISLATQISQAEQCLLVDGLSAQKPNTSIIQLEELSPDPDLTEAVMILLH